MQVNGFFYVCLTINDSSFNLKHSQIITDIISFEKCFSSTDLSFRYHDQQPDALDACLTHQLRFDHEPRYSNYAGGTECPLVISWPKGIKARGEVRNQYHHAVDIVPTILEICGLEMPKVYRGVEQYPLSGVSMKYSFDAKPDAPTQKHVQYYTMLGTRAIWQDGWKAVAVHAPLTGKGHFDQDKWETLSYRC
jgi:arylsulfatase A-like enzyme